MSQKISTKQAFLFTIINYVGVFIGIISTVLIYPRDKEMLGIVRFVDACAQIMFPILVLGSAHALINFYPSLNEKLQRKLFGYSLASIFKLSLLMLIALLICTYLNVFDKINYIWIAFPLAIFMAYIELFRRQATNLQKLSIPTLYEKIIPKIALPLVFILVLYGFTSFDYAIWLYVISYGLIVYLISTYIYKNYKFGIYKKHDDLFEKVPKNRYYSYSLYSFAGSFGSFFAFRVDSLMIPEFISFEANGTYNIGVTLAAALMIPATGVFALYAPIVSDFVKKEQWKELNIKYKEVAKTLFFIGAILYSCVVVGIEPLFKMLPTYENLAASIPIIILLGLNVVVNMTTGFNTEIISYSKYYRFNLITIISLMILNVSLNWILLTQTELGILGVAYSTLFSIMLFNAVKTIYIYKKMKLLPFDIPFIKMILLFVTTLAIVYYLPTSNSIYIDFTYKILLILSINTLVIYKTQWTPSVKYWIDLVSNKIFK